MKKAFFRHVLGVRQQHEVNYEIRKYYRRPFPGSSEPIYRTCGDCGTDRDGSCKEQGRCRELLIPGVQVFLEKSSNPARKTAYDLVCVNKGGRLINMDSQIPNKAALEWVRAGHLFPEEVQVTPEKTYGNSRFDLYACSDKRKAFIEVKGVTLEADNIARFPDAPTARGVKHLEELIHCMREGYEAYLLLVIQMKGITRFEPNWDTHREFGETLQKAKKAGVHILAYDCLVEPDGMEIQNPVPVCLEETR